jgi:hypothetical protein
MRARSTGLALAVVLCHATAGFGADAGAAEAFLFRGEFVYIIPRALSEEMMRLAQRAQWKHFPEHTRYVDVDGDGETDQVAAAFGASTGHGAQVRYRLYREEDEGLQLGRWYWGVLTAPEGDRLLEKFNP